MKFTLQKIYSKKTLHHNGPVYDLTVKEDHSYTIDGIIVHNSICKTRIMAGVGVPSLSSVVDCARARHKFSYYHQKSVSNIKLPSIILDGGVRYPADVVKSIIGGADAIMCGSVFAATEESPGEVIQREDGSLVKMYRGMASASVQKERRGGLKEGTCSEGVTTHLPYKGSIKDVLFGDDGFVGGLKSGMTYLNARTISELQKHDEYIVITGSSLNESHAYGTKK
jgi:IMP dehydrogenase